MSWQNNPFSIILLIGVFILAFTAFLAWRRRPMAGARTFTLLMLAMMEWVFAYAMELGSPALWVKIFWDRVEFLGIVLVPLAWLILTLAYTGSGKFISWRNILLLALEPAAILSLVVSDHYYGFIWAKIELRNINSLLMLAQTPGIGFWIHTVYSYLLMFTGSILLVRILIRPLSLYRKQAISLLIAALLPWCANILPFIGIELFPYLDLTPFVLILTGLIVTLLLFGFQFLNIVPVSYHAVIQSISDSIIVVDTDDNIIDLNPAAQNIFGCNASKIIGTPVTALLKRWNEQFLDNSHMPLADGEISVGDDEKTRYYDLRISPLKNHKGMLTGRLIVLRDITDLKNAERLKNELNALQGVMSKFIQAVALIIEMKDPYTAGHERRVAKLAKAIAEKMNLEPEKIEIIHIAATLHDIGKIYIPAEILSKPGQLSKDEYNLVKTHPRAAYDILKTVDFPWSIAEIVLQHHEKMDGSGYPASLAGNNILLEAKIIAVADLVEAMTSHRPYRPSTGLDKALKEISQNRGVLYDAAVVDACIEVLKEGIDLNAID
jgi:PAS domain S-box-containing protein/putative nucleotidyltransferase with HDIG domain